MTSRITAAWTTVFALALAGVGAARAEQCPRLPAGLVCAPMPEEENARRELLRALDQEGRDAVSRGDYTIAASAFGCLVEADPTPESAGNLTVVLREQGAMGDALLMARCAEQLAASGPALERASARRLDIERRVGLAPPADAAVVAPSLVTAPARPGTAPAPARAHRTWGYAAVGLGAAVLIGSGVLYALARQRAGQFSDEQQANGYSDRARQLRDDTQTLQTGTWLAAGVGAAAAVAGSALLTF
ncbi:MAG TPA: hypothetical protein VNO55_11855 [Polyangia bacterium]|nr:hypothetical protein [Polyangia bacterium]